MSTKVPKEDIIVMTTMIELESLFGPLFDEYFNGENQVVSKSSVVTTANVSDKRQQQPDSTSSTSTMEEIKLFQKYSAVTTADASVNRQQQQIILLLLLIYAQLVKTKQPSTQLKQKLGQYIIIDIEECRHGPSDAMHLLPSHSSFYQKKLCLICHGDTHLSIDISIEIVVIEKGGKSAPATITNQVQFESRASRDQIVNLFRDTMSNTLVEHQ
ncbi:hypothetical protein Tco_1176675 [Tanacetum coccineum]